MTKFIFPSKFTNRFYVADCSHFVRLSFGEILNGREEIHTSLVMVRDDAISLRNLLNEQFPVKAN